MVGVIFNRRKTPTIFTTLLPNTTPKTFVTLGDLWQRRGNRIMDQGPFPHTCPPEGAEEVQSQTTLYGDPPKCPGQLHAITVLYASNND
jgi:hypothetical protein